MITGLCVFQNRALRKILGSKRNSATRFETANEQLHKLCYSPNITQLIKSRMLWVTYGTHGYTGRSIQGFGGETRRKAITWKT